MFDEINLIITTMWFIMVTSIYMSSIKILLSDMSILTKFKFSYPREVVILRGVPGVGKDSFLYNRELKKKKKNYFLNISIDKFFYNPSNKYIFKREDINLNRNKCMQEFITGLELKVPTIYINDINHENWMYQNYVTLAKQYNYSVKIIELICSDYDQLVYFNKRSTHYVPLKYSEKVYNTFESNDIDDVLYIEPYIGNTHSYDDSLPKYPQMSKEELDNDLDEFMSNYLSDESDSSYCDSGDSSDSSDSGDSGDTSDTSDMSDIVLSDSDLSDSEYNQEDYIKHIRADEGIFNEIITSYIDKYDGIQYYINTSTKLYDSDKDNVEKNEITFQYIINNSIRATGRRRTISDCHFSIQQNIYIYCNNILQYIK